MLSKDYRDILLILSESDVEFMVVGAYALASHGYPRYTGDIDIWIKPAIANAEKTYMALKEFGAPLQDISIEELSVKGLVYQIGLQPLRIDIITEISGVAFDEAYKDRIIVKIDDLDVPVISLKHLIQNKLATGREKDLIDAIKLQKLQKRIE